MRGNLSPGSMNIDNATAKRLLLTNEEIKNNSNSVISSFSHRHFLDSQFLKQPNSCSIKIKGQLRPRRSKTNEGNPRDRRFCYLQRKDSRELFGPQPTFAERTVPSLRFPRSWSTVGIISDDKEVPTTSCSATIYGAATSDYGWGNRC